MTRARTWISLTLWLSSAACSFPDVSYRSDGGGGDGGVGNAGGAPTQGGGDAGGGGAATSTSTSTNTSTSTGMGGGPTCTDADGDKYVLEADNGACLPPDFLGYGDCDDENEDVHPNQPTYFDTPRPNFDPDLEAAWNYDCNDTLDLLYAVGCTALPSQDGIEVSAGAFGCGDMGMFRQVTIGCTNVEMRTQLCR